MAAIIGTTTARRHVALTWLSVLAVLCASCAGLPGESDPETAVDSLADVAAGSLLGTPRDFAGYPALATLTAVSKTVLYRSTSGIDGSATEVSGLVLVPRGDPPAGGWPVVAVGHATTGTDSRCAPSTHIGLLGALTTVIPFLANGYVVAMTDYEGLGTPGPHPYLDAATAGNNVIDAVRAAREVEPTASDSWIGYGVSQGGQAVWAANERAADYGDGLRLVGTISMSPATDLSPLVDAMVAGTLTAEQVALVPSVLTGLSVAHPDLQVTDYLRGVLYERRDVFAACEGENDGLESAIAESVTPSDYAPVDEAAADRLRAWLTEAGVPGAAATAPMFVGYGELDRLALPEWTVAAVQRACALGDTIELREAPGQGHGILNLGSAPAEWLDGRFAGTPAPSTCN
ncbi:lipase family protein [Rhodococcus sp. MEB041]|uniref:lipase family protein n=1 Tax=Rhodococcus sp. MEB041 TaxID=3040323 RepID=UPI00254CCD23|nr:lipase family protein [Rhodococcus sp. MEB041]